MKAVKFAITTVLLVMLFLPAGVEAGYIGGLSIDIENNPSEIFPGGTITVDLRVINENDDDVTVYIRTYLYSFNNQISFPLPDYRNIVFLNEGGSSANETEVTVGAGENKLFQLELRIKPDISTINENGASATLRARVRQYENGDPFDVAEGNNRTVLVLPTPGPEFLAPYKFTVGFVVAAAIVFSVRNFQANGHNGKNGRKITS